MTVQHIEVKICDHHADLIVAALRERGLSAFVGKSAEENAELVKARRPNLVLACAAKMTIAIFEIAGEAPFQQKNEAGAPACPACIVAETCRCNDPECAARNLHIAAANVVLEEAMVSGILGTVAQA